MSQCCGDGLLTKCAKLRVSFSIPLVSLEVICNVLVSQRCGDGLLTKCAKLRISLSIPLVSLEVFFIVYRVFSLPPNRFLSLLSVMEMVCLPSALDKQAF